MSVPFWVLEDVRLSRRIESKMSVIPERHMFKQGGNGRSNSGLALSTDAKPRLKWTPDLHERFIEAVNQLGGPDSK